MKKLFVFLVFLPIMTWADIRPGDIILLPLDCYVCRQIANETGSVFSHSGIVVKVNGELKVAESLGKVEAISMQEFLGRRFLKNERPHLYRFYELSKLYQKSKSQFKNFTKKLEQVFSDEFVGAPFDHEYRWDNFNAKGEELLYCSEFITKLINKFLKNKMSPAAMDFSQNLSFWQRYFNSGVPQGELGNSPASFEESKQLFLVEIL